MTQIKVYLTVSILSHQISPHGRHKEKSEGLRLMTEVNVLFSFLQKLKVKLKYYLFKSTHTRLSQTILKNIRKGLHMIVVTK